MGTCVGKPLSKPIAKRNYRYFIIFLALSAISILYFAIQLIIFIVYLFTGVSDGIPVAVLVVILIFSIPIAVIGIALLAFGIFHMVLQCR